MITVEGVREDAWETVRRVRLQALSDTPDWFWATYDDEVSKPEEWWRDFVRRGAWFIAEDETGPAGIAGVLEDRDAGPGTYALISMWVDARCRNRGVGRRLVESAIAWARDRKARELTLFVTATNDAARRLYGSCGFRATGRTEPLPRNPELVELEMTLQLAG